MSQIRRTSLLLLLSAILSGNSSFLVAQGGEPQGAEILAPYLEHQAEQRYHKCSAGLYESIQAGLPAGTSAQARALLAQCLSAIRLPTSSTVLFYEAVRLQRDSRSAEALLGEWGAEVFKIEGGALYGLGGLKDLKLQQASLAPGEGIAFLLGLKALASKDDVGAILSFQDIPKDHALAAQARYLQGVAYARQGDSSLAKEAFESALALGREGAAGIPMGDLIPLCWMALGRLSYGEGEFREALGHYGRAQMSERLAPEARREIAWTLLAMERLPQAFEEIKLLLDSDDWQPDAYLLLASAYMAAGRLDTASEILNAAGVRLKADLATLKDVQRRFSRRHPETLVPHLLIAMGEEVEEPEIPLALPKGFRSYLISDWRLEAARLHLKGLDREARWIAAQMDWWTSGALGQALPGLLEEARAQVIREAGLVGLDRLESEIRRLDTLAGEAILLRRELGRLRVEGRGDDYMLGTLPAWPFVEPAKEVEGAPTASD